MGNSLHTIERWWFRQSGEKLRGREVRRRRRAIWREWAYLCEDTIRCGRVNAVVRGNGTGDRIEEREAWFGKQDESK
jgi:hypothetical protein